MSKIYSVLRWRNDMVLLEWLDLASTKYCNITSLAYLLLIILQGIKGLHSWVPNGNSWILHSFQTTDNLSTTIIPEWCQHFLYLALPTCMLSSQGGLGASDQKWSYQRSPNMEISNGYEVSAEWYTGPAMCVRYHASLYNHVVLNKPVYVSQLGLGHKTMVCTLCPSIFLSKHWPCSKKWSAAVL